MILTEEKNLVAVAKASIRPGKIVFYTQIIDRNKIVATENKLTAKERTSALLALGEISTRVCEINSHNFELSKKASGRIKEKVSWLYELARNKTITTTNGKILNSFKMNFITLTLPSLQSHTTAEITATCLNQFLTECKSKFNLANYVWRLEFQKNGNAHYHIATDTYLDYTECKLIWNRCLQKLGYISAYSAKFTGMSFQEYSRNYSNNGKVDFATLRMRYGRGCATRWDSPNTVDVRAVSNAKNIAFYISKYITKKSEHSLNSVVSLREPSESNLRLWYCSSSLSKLDKIEIFIEEYDKLVWDCFTELTTPVKIQYDYVTVWYFKNGEQSNESKRAFWELYRRYSSALGYIPAI